MYSSSVPNALYIQGTCYLNQCRDFSLESLPGAAALWSGWARWARGGELTARMLGRELCGPRTCPSERVDGKALGELLLKLKQATSDQASLSQPPPPSPLPGGVTLGGQCRPQRAR